MNNWLSLNEYSNKYQVSLSTLRRRIKSNKIKFTFQHGKYFLNDSQQEKSSSAVNISPRPNINSNLDTASSPEINNQKVPAEASVEIPAKAPVKIPSEKAIPLKTNNNIFSDSNLASYSFFNIDSSVTKDKSNQKASLEAANTQNAKFSKKEMEYKALIQKQKNQILDLQSKVINLNTLVMFLDK